MHIVFISILETNRLKKAGLYSDLIEEFAIRNHNVTVIGKKSKNTIENSKSLYSNIQFIDIPIFHYEKRGKLAKALSLFSMDLLYLKSIQSQKIQRPDLLIFHTPPVNLVRTLSYIKNKFSIPTYLWLKDIFPQNAVDLEYFSSSSVLYMFFKNRERRTYGLADAIGCMSPANVLYMKNNYPETLSKLHINPNSIKLENIQNRISAVMRVDEKWNVPTNTTKIVYTGNLGDPQGLEFLLQVIEKLNSLQFPVVFIVIGSGAKKDLIKNAAGKLSNLVYLPEVKREELQNYLVQSDIGLISLDSRFTIPNYPSRLLDYLANSLPIFAIVDKATDIGSIAASNGFGDYCDSGEVNDVVHRIINFISNNDLKAMGVTGNKYLRKHYQSRKSVEIIESWYSSIKNKR